MELQKLVAVGKEMGMSFNEMHQWVKKERAADQEGPPTAERAAEREAALDAHEHEMVRLAPEREILQLKLNLQSQQVTSDVTPVDPSADGRGSDQGWRSPHKLIPPFNEARHKHDAGLLDFGRVVVSQGWPDGQLAFAWGLCLSGEAFCVL